MGDRMAQPAQGLVCDVHKTHILHNTPVLISTKRN
eukprot:CAMPEP_0177216178 /NCGR_PEP_ID=MMETSP0367-20130122/34620_1 /TAXON_ID=447022 ORGANISM="Scrippsiella hangoei-like, Strain SHHI-4" /NCGR_SAMPLE_ID=MMETSP0367 /ASSEMBLY_ACC=CAM_ASM_000362 /LENGTH=34 /DNA_ID= /DNA_START= /DNA_END= /DNA_ORIENTATION=